MSNAVLRDHEPALELRIRPRGRLELTTFSALLLEVRHALLEIDQVALPRRAPRIEWSVVDLQREGDLRMLLAPVRRPRGRDDSSLAMAPVGLVAGVATLRAAPEIPSLFSPGTVQRVARMGQVVNEGLVDHLSLLSLNGVTREAVIDQVALDGAEKAVRPSSHAYSSVQGVLSMLKIGARSVRAEIRTQDRRGVSVHASLAQVAELREKLGERVLAGGILKRNSVGQPVDLDLLQIELAPQPTSLTAWDLLGSNPDATGGLSTREYLDKVRGG